MAITLRSHQVEAVKFLYHRKGGLCGDEMGLGKTFTACGFIHLSLATNLCGAFFVVCPATIVGQWAGDIQRFFGFEPTICNNNNKQPKQNWIYVVSYQYAARNIKMLSHLMQGSGVVFDEIHRLKNDTSKTFKVFDSVGFSLRLGLTGTPVHNRLEDLYGILRMVRWRHLPPRNNWYDKYIIRQLKEVGGKTRKRRMIYVIKGYRKGALEELHQILSKDVMIRRTKYDLRHAVDIPPKTVQYVPVAERSKLYERVFDRVVLDDHPALVKVVRLQQATSGYDAYENAFDPTVPKVTMLRDLLDDRSGAVVVFFKFEQTLMMVKEAFKDLPIFYYTGKNANNRSEQLNQWAESTSSIVFCTIKAGGVGLNLVHADTAIIMESELSHSDMAQAESRIDRIGQVQKTNVIYLYQPKTVDEVVLSLIRNKQAYASAIVDGGNYDQVYRLSLGLKV